MANSCIKILVRGVEAQLLFNTNTAELFTTNMQAIVQRYPDHCLEYAAVFRPATLAYSAYYMDCTVNAMPVVLSFDDFCLWSADKEKTISGRQDLNNIHQLYLKHVNDGR